MKAQRPLIHLLYIGGLLLAAIILVTTAVTAKGMSKPQAGGDQPLLTPTATLTRTPVPPTRTLGGPTDTPTFTPTPCSGHTFAPPQPLDIMPSYDIAAADFNNDGKPDLAVPAGFDHSQTVGILLGNGDGTFQPTYYYPAGFDPTAIAVSDFNADGKLDLAISQYNGSAITVLLGNGDGSFQAPTPYTVPSGPIDIAAADFNHDNKPDLAVASFFHNAIVVLLGNGDGTFQAPTSYSLSNGTLTLIIDDFNRDGNPDLVVGLEVVNKVGLLLGNSDGTFQAPTYPTTGSYPQGLATRDLNGDDNPDIVTASYSDTGSVNVVLGNGNGTFQPPVSYAVGSRPTRVVIADFDRDGKLDLLVANFYGTTVSELLGNGAGTFGPAHNYDIGNRPFALVATDFNLDGRPDVAVTTRISSYIVTLLINTCAPQTLTATPVATATYTPSATATPATTQTATGIATNTGTPAATQTATPSGPTPTDCPIPFVDISGNVFYTAIKYLYCRGVINGIDATHYGPAGISTRAQFAKVVVLGFGIVSYTPTTPTFTDVPSSYFAYLYIESGYHAGILSGYDVGTCTAIGATFPCYGPNRPITRAQLTKLVVAAAGYTSYTPTTPTFSDVGSSNVFYTSIETAHHKGVINGYPDNTFRPNNNIRRDEMAQIVYKGVTTP